MEGASGQRLVFLDPAFTHASTIAILALCVRWTISDGQHSVRVPADLDRISGFARGLLRESAVPHDHVTLFMSPDPECSQTM